MAIGGRDTQSEFERSYCSWSHMNYFKVGSAPIWTEVLKWVLLSLRTWNLCWPRENWTVAAWSSISPEYRRTRNKTVGAWSGNAESFVVPLYREGGYLTPQVYKIKDRLQSCTGPDELLEFIWKAFTTDPRMLSVKELLTRAVLPFISLCCSYGTSTLTGCYKLDRHQELFKRRKNLNSYYARICFRMKMHFSFYLLTITFGSGLNILYSILEWITLQCGRCFTYDCVQHSNFWTGAKLPKVQLPILC